MVTERTRHLVFDLWEQIPRCIAIHGPPMKLCDLIFRFLLLLHHSVRKSIILSFDKRHNKFIV